MAFDRRETVLLLLGDFGVLVASLWLTLFIRNLAFPALGYFSTNFVPFLPMFCISLAVFYIAGLYEKPTRPIRRVMGTRILGAQAATVALAAILFFILPLSIAPKTILIIYLGVSVALESTWRFYRMQREVAGAERLLAVLVGTGQKPHELFDEVNGNDRYLIRFAQIIDTAGKRKGTLSSSIAAQVAAGVRVVVVDASDPAVVREAEALYELMADGASFLEFAALYEEIFDREPLEHLTTEQVLSVLPKRHALYDIGKRIFDLALALVGSLVAIPFIVLAALALLVSGGMPFIRHDRIGKGGRIFRIVKLRTMLLNDHGDPELQKKNRVTALGRVLRATRIDELPQLWNVLMGDLSFIGPRPELPILASVYEQEIPQYRIRHLIVPGLSGWAQIHDYDAPRGGADVPRTRRKLSFDLYYLKHRSFGLDLVIALKTLRALISLSGT